MEDFVVSIAALVTLVAGLLLAWRRVAGPPATRGRAAARVAVSALVVALALGAGVYQLTKSRTFQVAGDLVTRVETREKVVALTFDDGPTPAYTETVLRVLAERNAKATFFLTGAEAQANPDQLRAIVDAGHELGNHSYTHRRLYFLPTSAVADEVERTDAVFRAAGYGAPTTFRMPGCKRFLTTPLYLARTGRTTVIWDLEPDSIAGIAGDADAMADHVVRGARPGSIVLMHVMYDGRDASREALPRIIDELTERGYRFVTVSGLLALR